MARAQGAPDFPIAVVDDDGPTVDAHGSVWEEQVAHAAAQVERILLLGGTAG